MTSASVLIPAYNEEQNIAPLLQRVLVSGDGAWTLDDVIVIASGCTDATVPRASDVAARHPQVRVVVQAEREGKASAINVGLAAAANDVIVLISGDVMPAIGAIQALLQRLDDPSVGVAGGMPVPLNDIRTFTGFAASLQWRLHHVISLASPEPKCGEMIAFRRAHDGRPVVPHIPAASAVDEVSIQALVREAGLRSAYAADAVVYNWAPDNLRDWLVQRRRVNAGHVLSAREGYHPSTMSGRTVLRALLRDSEVRRQPVRAAAAVGVEVVARVLGHVDVTRGHVHTVWKVAETTKRAIPQESA